MFRTLVTLSLALLCGSLGAQVAPPLHTKDNAIVDSSNRPVRLLSVNWYGFDEKDFVAGGLDHAQMSKIIDLIQAMGFNSVRLPWANETLKRNPVVAASAVSANPQFLGKTSMEIFDAMVQALTARHIMVILDNHMSDADWCCNNADGDGLWYTDHYPEARWIADWQAMARRYAENPWVVGADLRNELRGKARWGGDDAAVDWRAAAMRGGNAVLAVNPKLLIMVEGPSYSTKFKDVARVPIELDVAHRLVLSPHAYSIGHTYNSYSEAAKVLDDEFGPLLTQPHPLPLWVGEFGACVSTGFAAYGHMWLQWFARYCNEHGIANVSYWPLNSTESTGHSRKLGAPDYYGLLTLDWTGVQSPEVLATIHSIQPQR